MTVVDGVLELEGPSAQSRPRSGVEAIRSEIDGYLQKLQQLNDLEPDEVFRRLSAWTARAAEIRTQLVRLENARAERLVHREIEPFIADCERQFRYHSRLHAVRDTEARMTGGFA